MVPDHLRLQERVVHSLGWLTMNLSLSVAQQKIYAAPEIGGRLACKSSAAWVQDAPQRLSAGNSALHPNTSYLQARPAGHQSIGEFFLGRKEHVLPALPQTFWIFAWCTTIRHPQSVLKLPGPVHALAGGIS